MSKSWSFETNTIHAGQEPDPATGAVNVPIFATSTYQQTAVGEYPFSDYARVDNPTRSAFQNALATLEGARHGFAFASGLAATDTLLRTLSPGDHIVLGTDAYGGTYRLISKILTQSGVEFSTIDLSDTENLASSFTSQTKILWIETPSNPTLQVVDIAATSEIAHQHGIRVVVDNTFATPYLQRPLSHGADVVVHSTTKYIGGHSDVVGGFLAFNDDELAEHIKFLQYAVGAIQSPFDSYLLLRGLKTLAVRLDRHCSNAMTVANFLENHCTSTAGVLSQV
jgi:cystathionine beta-lyase/cystathionine gamma-synthase